MSYVRMQLAPTPYPQRQDGRRLSLVDDGNASLQDYKDAARYIDQVQLAQARMESLASTLEKLDSTADDQNPSAAGIAVALQFTPPGTSDVLSGRLVQHQGVCERLEAEYKSNQADERVDYARASDGTGSCSYQGQLDGQGFLISFAQDPRTGVISIFA